MTADFQDFHILIWNAIRQGQYNAQDQKAVDSGTGTPVVRIEEMEPTKSDRELVYTYLSTLNRWLESQPDPVTKAMYRKGAQKTLDDVERALRGIKKAQLDEPSAQTQKNRLVGTVKAIFRVFLPLEQRGPICSKVWGALHNAVTVSQGTMPNIRLI